MARSAAGNVARIVVAGCAVAMCAMWSGCSACEERGVPEPYDPEYLPSVFVLPPVEVSGRIAAGDGTPAVGVTVTIISPEDPHSPSWELATTVTDDQGQFALDPVPRDGVSHLLLARGTTRYAYRLWVRRDAPRSYVTETIHFEPHRDLRFRVECPHAPVGDDPEIWARAEWMAQTFADVQLLAIDGEEAPQIPNGIENPLEPGVDHLIVEPPSSARRFERTLHVPPGELQIFVRGGCGEAATPVVVPRDGDVPITRFVLAGSPESDLD